MEARENFYLGNLGGNAPAVFRVPAVEEVPIDSRWDGLLGYQHNAECFPFSTTPYLLQLQTQVKNEMQDPRKLCSTGFQNLGVDMFWACCLALKSGVCDVLWIGHLRGCKDWSRGGG